MGGHEADRLAMTMIYLRAAGLHLRLSAFFDSSHSQHYWEDLLALWGATTSFLEGALNIETATGSVLIYVSNYILQMIIAAGFTLMKLLNSFFASHIDLDYGKSLFTRTIWAIRKISVAPNDLPSRLAEVLAQLWRGGGARSRADVNGNGTVDSSLQLKVRCRMSVSHVFDAVWRWREDYQAKGRGNLECKLLPSPPAPPSHSSCHLEILTRRPAAALRNPTNPDSAAESSASSVMDTSLAPPGLLAAGGGPVTPGPSNSFGESNYEVFDPLNWMLDGFVDFPYSLTAVQGLEAQGMA